MLSNFVARKCLNAKTGANDFVRIIKKLYLHKTKRLRRGLHEEPNGKEKQEEVRRNN